MGGPVALRKGAATQIERAMPSSPHKRTPLRVHVARFVASRRQRMRAAVAAVALVFALMQVPALLRRGPAADTVGAAPVALASAAISLGAWLPSLPDFLVTHDQLKAPPAHFQPPSLFSAARALRRFDAAWRVRAAVDELSSSSSSSSLSSSSQTFDSSSDTAAGAATHARIAFAIQASGETVALLPRLLSRIHHARNLYVVHIDAKTPRAARAALAVHITRNAAYARNVHLVPSEMLTYKGISAVMNSVALMTAALRLRDDWDYYINLSAGDYPLVDADRMGLLLARPRAPPGSLNFVWFFPRKEWRPYSFRTRYNYWDPAACGYQSARARLFHMAAQKRSPLEESRAYVFTKAEAWSILSRPFVQFVARASFAKRMLLAHQHVLSVSEHFITDTLYNHPVWRATVVPEAFRKVVWYFRGARSGQHPYTLDRGPEPFAFWPDLEHTRSLFARKFSKVASPVMDRIDEQLSGICGNRTGANPAKYQRERDEFYRRIVEYFDSMTQATLRQQGIEWPADAYPPLVDTPDEQLDVRD